MLPLFMSTELPSTPETPQGVVVKSMETLSYGFCGCLKLTWYLQENVGEL